MTLTAVLARYALNLKRENVSDAAWEKAKMFFVDGLGCMLAGAGERPSQIALEYVREFGGQGPCSIIGRRGVRADPAGAMTVNGLSAHVHDVDDVLVSIDGHPTTVVLPAVLAGAELVKASGEDAMMAYVTGIEVLRLVGEGFNHNARYYCLGWHSTSTLGIFGATAALGRLLGLTERQLVYAFGIAASESSGLKNNFGTMVKPLHAGRAAAKAFYVVQLAKRGFISSPEVMEGNEGLAHVTVKTVEMDRVHRAIQAGDSVFLNPGLSMKPWPCCKQNHSAIAATQNLLKKHSFTAADVEHVRCRMQPVSLDCLKYKAPKTKLEGKFSVQYNVAVTLLRGTVCLSDYDGEEITETAVLELMPRIESVLDDGIAGGTYNNGKYDSIVEIRLKDGREFREWVEFAKGDPAVPMTRAEIDEKFADGMSRVCRRDLAKAVLELAWNADRLPCITQLLDKIEKSVRETA